MREPVKRWQCRGVRLLAIAWIVVTPYGFAAAASASWRVRRAMARHYVPMLAAGWTGVALLVLGAFAVHGTARAPLLALGAPLAGLSFWSRADDGGGGGGGGSDPDDDGPEDDGVDWDRFMGDLERWAAAQRQLVRR